MKFLSKIYLLLPLTTTILAGISLIICYVVAVVNNHVDQPPFVPFVSDTGAIAPESCIFSLALAWMAFFFIIMSLLHYQYVNHHGYQSKINKASLAMAILASFGITLVCCFQWTNVLSVHVVGAVMVYLLGNVYCWLIFAINLQTRKNTSLIVIILRGANAALQSLCFLLFITLLIVNFTSPDKKTTVQKVSALAEWMETYLLLAFVASFTYEFRHVEELKYSLVASNTQVGE